MNTQLIKVRYASQAYNTNRIKGASSSSTSSPEAAARGLAQKLFGPSLIDVRQLRELGVHSEWEATADATIMAWCWANGEIEFGTEVPEDACAIAFGPDRALREQLRPLAGNDTTGGKGTLVLNCVHQAKNQEEAFDRLKEWLSTMIFLNGRPLSYGVVFGLKQELHAA